MSQHDYVIANQSGLNFRSDLNNALLAIVSQNSGATAPATTYAFMPWADTSGGTPILKYRNAANSAWVTIGDLSLTNLGLLPLTGGTLSGFISFSNTDYIKIPVGTTAQRPGSPANGMIRYNTDLSTFEGYKSGAWGAIGGGGYVVSSSENITSGGSISSSTTEPRQLRPVQGDSAPMSASTTPFGSSGGWKDGTEITLVGLDDSNTLTLTYNDAAKGLIGSFSTIELTKGKMVTCVYIQALDRFIVQGA